MLGIPKGEICLMPNGDINCDTIQESGERIYMSLFLGYGEILR